MKINWDGFATTKGRQVYASVLYEGVIPLQAINYEGGFVIGWDQWSEGRITSLANGLFFSDQ